MRMYSGRIATADGKSRPNVKNCTRFPSAEYHPRERKRRQRRQATVDHGHDGDHEAVDQLLQNTMAFSPRTTSE